MENSGLDSLQFRYLQDIKNKQKNTQNNFLRHYDSGAHKWATNSMSFEFANTEEFTWLGVGEIALFLGDLNIR